MRSRALLLTAFAIGTVGFTDSIADEPPARPESLEDAEHEPQHVHARSPIRGYGFPEGVLALTWDDGPDRNTMELGRYLRAHRVSGTFFVVRGWERGVSEEPGYGPDPFVTGYSYLPILGDLVGLGHRIGNHTDGHVILAGSSVPAATVIEQLGRAQVALDPFLANELRIFRPPGGYWSDAAGEAIDSPLFASTVGPVRWDIDEKDWNSCFRHTPAAVAGRYLATIDRLKRGIVLMHDRVGDVGSRFAVELARVLVPALEARGYVFAAPVLAFTRFEARADLHDAREFRLADLDGDGRADVCSTSLACARSVTTARDGSAMPRTAFTSASFAANLRVDPMRAAAPVFGDVDGDGRADVCFLRDDDVACALAASPTGVLESWSSSLGVHDDGISSLRLADVDGDGRADACVRRGDRIDCATSTGRSFAPATTWIDASAIDTARVELADVDGDGRADACSGGICAPSTGESFGLPSRWSSARELTAATGVRFGDLNGDGRADACVPTAEGVACAFSNGHKFTAPSIWLSDRVSAIELADVNGDGRADVCALAGRPGEVWCGLAP